jgi:nucleoside-diphosphate-sugar epimerase
MACDKETERRVFVAGASGAIGTRLVPQLVSAGHQVIGTKTEDDPLDPAPLQGARESSAAMRYLDEAVTAFGGIVLRYGGFYGAANDGLVEPVRKRMFPIVGDGGGVFSWIHLDDAAAATVLALDHDGPAIYNIVDDDPAPVSEWLPVLAESLGAKPPRRVPRWLAGLFAGEAAVMMGTESRGASNAKAKHEFGWTLRYPTWRDGFLTAYARTAPQPRASNGRWARIAEPQSPRSGSSLGLGADELGPPRRSMWVSRTDPQPDGVGRDRCHVERRRGRGRFERHDAHRARRDRPSAV